jgi:hypothetical protein
MAKRKLNMSLTRYIFSHGTGPRGYGHWGFELVFEYADGTSSTEVVWFDGYYQGAAKRAKIDAEARGAVAVSVCP